MFKSVKTYVAIFATAGVLPVSANAAIYTSTLDFEGAGLFREAGNLLLSDLEGAAGNGLDFGDDIPLRDALVADLPDGTYTLLTGAFATGGGLDLPDIDEDAIWTVSIDAFIEGSYQERGEDAQGFGFSINESIDSVDLGFGAFSLNDASDFLGGPIFPSSDALAATILALLGSNEYTNFVGASTSLILSDDIADFPGAFVLTNDDNPLEETNDFLGGIGLGLPLPDLITADGFFGGTITLTAKTRDDPPVTVSEPGSLALIGFGIAGFGLARRRRA